MLIQLLFSTARPTPFFNERRSNASGFLATLLFFAVVFLWSQTAFSQAQAPIQGSIQGPSNTESTSVGELHLQGTSGNSNALLLDTNIQANVVGLIATINLTQRFKNDTDEWVNGRYVFPLPENGAIDGMTMTIGERVIKGEIKEKQAAKKVFEAAKKAGKKASLLEQHRPNMFSMSVANIPPRSEVVANIRIIDRVVYQNQTFSLRFPTTITPRYIPGTPIALNLDTEQEVMINEHSGWAANTDVVPDANDITPPQTHSKVDQTTHHFSFMLTLNAGIGLANIGSQTHAIDLLNASHIYDANGSNNQQFSAKQVHTVSLTNKREPMNQDLVVTWSPIKTQAPTAALFQQQLGGEHFSMAMLLPPTANVVQALPTETTFIIDSSGSMAGESMRQAKRSLQFALNKLSPSDRFNVIDFDSNFRPLFDRPKLATDSHLNQAMRMVQNLTADGGTEMFAPLDFALQTPTYENYLKQVIFITDGSVGNESQLFKLIHDKLGDARLFTVGIGSAPNAYFMRKAAQFGRGKFTYVDYASNADQVMQSLFETISKPVARDLVVDYEVGNGATHSASAIEQFPAKIPDLYAGEPVMIVTKSSDALRSINVSGTLLGNAWSRKLSSSSTSNTTDNIDAIWARQKVAHLMDSLSMSAMTQEQVKPAVIALGIKHHLLTRYTSFVAVEQTPSKPAELKSHNKKVANLMPKGSAMPIPQTATPATLLGVMGSGFLLLGLCVRNRRFYNKLLLLITQYGVLKTANVKSTNI